MIGLDTNVLLRALVSKDVWADDHPGQTQAARALVGDHRAIFFVNHIVLAEIVWVLSKPLGQSKSVVVAIVEGLLAAANVVVDRREAVVAALAAFRQGKPGFADHLIGHVNRMAGCETTMSFDKDAKLSSNFTRLALRDA